MKAKFLSTILAVAVFAASCQKDGIESDADAGKNLNEISVSAQFDWKTTQDVNFSVGVSDSRFSGNSKHVITIYAGDPAKDGQVISKGAATLVTPFNTKIALPKTLSEVYVVKTAPDGSKVSGSVAVVSTNISVAVDASGVVGSVSGISSAKGFSKLAASNGASTLSLTKKTAPSVPSGAVTLTSGTNNLAANTAYVAGNVSVSNLNVNNSGVSIYVTGTATLGINISNGIKIYVLPGAKLTFQNTNYNGSYTLENFGEIAGLNNFKVTQGSTFYNDAQSLSLSGFEIAQNGVFTNFGQLTVGGQISNAGTLNNGGTVTHNGQLNSNGSTSVFENTGTYVFNSSPNIGGTFENSGTLTINASGDTNFNGAQDSYNTGTITANSAKLNVSGKITNHGSIVANILNFTGSSNIKNYCKLYAHSNATLDAIVHNYSYIYVGTYTDVNGSGKLNQYSYDGGQKAMFSTNEIRNSAGSQNFIGQGTAFSLVKIRTSVGGQINNGGVLFLDKTYVIKPVSQSINSSKFSGGAAVLGTDDNYYIEKSSCNDEGNGTAPAPEQPDTDGDGIIDTEDDYPNDPTKAFAHYSVNYNAGGSSIAFEDNWPSKGDYDLNDIVITYRYLVISNADNKVVHIKADYKLLATGGSFRNGAGVQFNIPAGKAKNFVGPTGTELESGQDSIVIILFKDSRSEQLTWNTDLQQPASEIKEYAISFDVEDGPNMDNFGIGVYNPFIWNNTTGYGRGYETHLLGQTPTNKANTSLFGTADDNSVAGRKYSTNDNLPYALEIPTAPFKYPLERVAITDVYLKFAQWASSGGSQYADWYTNSASGYVNNSLIYTR